MQKYLALLLPLLAAPAAAGEADFITPEAGNAVSQNIAVQAEVMWPLQSGVLQIDTPADYAIRRLVASEAAGTAVTSQAAATAAASTSGQ